MLEFLFAKGTKQTFPFFAFDVIQKASSPLAVYHSNMANLPGQIYQLGGITTGNAQTAACYKYDIASNSWSSIASLPNGPSATAISFGYQSKVYYIGGGAIRKASRYNPVNNTWEALPDVPRDIAGEPPFIILNNKLYVLPMGSETTVIVYDFAANQWSTLPVGTGTIPSISSATSFCSVGSRVYVVTRDGTFSWYDAETNSWGSLPVFPMATQYGGALFYYGGRLYLVGGWNGSGVNKIIWVYDTANGWYQNGSLSQAQYVHHVQQVDGFFYLLGGSTNGGAGGGLNTLFQLGKAN